MAIFKDFNNVKKFKNQKKFSLLLIVIHLKLIIENSKWLKLNFILLSLINNYSYYKLCLFVYTKANVLNKCLITIFSVPT